MPYYTYILRCKDDSLYTGITTDLARRIAEHNGWGDKGAKYTASRRPVRLEAAWESSGRAEASKLEYRLRTLSRSGKEQVITGKMPDSIDLSQYSRIHIENIPAF